MGEKTANFKEGDKVVTLVNGFTGEIRVCEIVEIKYGDKADVKYGDSSFDKVFVKLSDCTPAGEGQEVGDLVQKVRGLSIEEGLRRW